MNAFNNPAFWEWVGAILVAVALAPLMYLLYFAARAMFDARKNDYLRNQPSASLFDPVFGELQFFEHLGCWEGGLAFSAIQSDVAISIDANENGPTDEQRSLYRQIEQKYNVLYPEIRRALVEYVEHDWDFDLWGLAISDDTHSMRWTAEFNAMTEEDGDMGYSVEVVNWIVSDVYGSD